MSRAIKPPRIVSVKWCPVCGRTDRYTPFTGSKHFMRGKPCPGKPEQVDYTRKVL